MGSYKNDNKLIGFFGRVSYGYANKYNALVSVRQEGSSKFGENNKWGTFPSVSLGWTISNEQFMKGITWLNNLKLRAGYGVTGVIPSASYQSLTQYSLGDSYYYENGKWKPGLVVNSNPNPDLKWETSAEFNFGLDWSVLNDRLSGSVDVYTKKTSDMLWWFTVPTPPNLYNRTLANVGEMRNSGVEIAINATPVQTKNFEWKTTATMSHNVNKLLSLSNDLYETTNQIDDAGLGEPISLSTQRLEVGKSIGNFYGMKSVGVSENGLWMIENVKTGKIEEFTDNMLSNDDYRQYLGNTLPKVYLGWSNTFRYKNFDLSFQMTGQFGFKILNEARAYYENNSVAYNRLKSVRNAPYGGENVLSTAQKQTFVSYYLEKGDFLKMTNMTLGYTVPLRNNTFVKNIRAYVSGDNLFCITGYDGLDPELSNSDARSAGIDWRDKYPSIRSFTFGVNITF
ncbi:TonB-dependent receptor [Bacteroides reticulotermitis JCM 10512]|uniref:TonB-dependent receptor n=2 Tax=Bacteroides reticulotermitis TaxID=1133319 RepID=W4UZM6_9BACE|nr:TonB-dependent receptor [Bacteroides reticulotermitis JCM 10512]